MAHSAPWVTIQPFGFFAICALLTGCTPTVVAICVVVAPPGDGEAKLTKQPRATLGRDLRFGSGLGTCTIELPPLPAAPSD